MNTLSMVWKAFLSIFELPKPKGIWYQEGEEAYWAGTSLDSCPYQISWQRDQWMDGYKGRPHE